MKQLFLTPILLVTCILVSAQNGLLVFQTDFGLKDGAVAEMKGVCMQVSPGLKIFDLTHEIPPYNIWEAAYRLDQAAQYWPAGTVFVSVVDPGVGSARKSIVLKTKTGHFFVTPDNGTLTLVATSLGISEVREIDEKVNRLPGSEHSFTFHGRDVFAYTAAKLSAGKISFQQVGRPLTSTIVMINYQPPMAEKGVVKGTIPVLDVQYGNVWTNIPATLLQKLQVGFGDSLQVSVFINSEKKFSARMPYVKTFSDVPADRHLAYINSLMNVSIALNMGDFAKQHSIESGPDWRVEISK